MNRNLRKWLTSCTTASLFLSLSACNSPSVNTASSHTSTQSSQSAQSSQTSSKASSAPEQGESSINASSETASSEAGPKLDIVQELGTLDYPPLLFSNQGWVIHKDGQYEYYSSDGTPVVKDRGFDLFSFYAGESISTVATPEPSTRAMLHKTGIAIAGPGSDSALLPYDHWPDDVNPGGIGGAISGAFYYLEDGTIQVDPGSIPEYPDYNPPKFIMTLFSHDVKADGCHTNPFHVWIPEHDILIGPYPAGSTVSYYQMHESQLMNPTARDPNIMIGELFWKLDESSGYYIVNGLDNTMVGPFDSVEITDPAYMGGRIGDTYILFDKHLNEVYRAGIHTGGAPANGYVPVEIGGQWIITTMDSLSKQPVSFTKKFDLLTLQAD